MRPPTPGMPTVRSSELAQFAGVTVRTLRHYHRTGVLPEPERSANGYREYRVSDLVRLLSALRLRELGLSLSEIATMLDDPRARLSALERADAELSSEIAALTARRDRIRRMKDDGILPELGPLVDVAVTSGAMSALSQLDPIERELFVLVAHLGKPPAVDWLLQIMPELAEFHEAHDADPSVLGERFLATPADAPPEVWETLLAESLATYRPIFREMIQRTAEIEALGSLDNPALERLQDGWLREQLSPAHRTFLTRFMTEVEAAPE